MKSLKQEEFDANFESKEPISNNEIVYELGSWDANDGKGYRDHTLTSKDFEKTGYCDYMGDTYEESEMPEYIERFGKDK